MEAKVKRRPADIASAAARLQKALERFSAAFSAGSLVEIKEALHEYGDALVALHVAVEEEEKQHRGDE